MEEPAHVKYLDDGIPVQLIRHGAVLRAHVGRADPEDAALAQPLDEDALLVGTDQHTSLQVAQQLARDLPRPLVLNELGGREVDALHAVRTVEGAADQVLLRGDPAAFGVIDHGALHQLPSVVETDQHLGKG